MGCGSVASAFVTIATAPAYASGDSESLLPPGVKAVWDLAAAEREATATRERVCLNGLWRWQPAPREGSEVPGENWGFFKVPGSWPGITDYMQKDSQTLFQHAAWKEQNPARVRAAWYQREFTVPESWTGRRIALELEYVNSLVTVYVDRQRVGEIRFPGGELDLGGACRAGGQHQLSLLVLALPLKAVMQSYTDTAAAREVEGAVARRGLCGDAFLVSTPPAARFTDVRVDTSVRKRELLVHSSFESLDTDVPYRLRGRICKAGEIVHEFTSPAFRRGDLAEGWHQARESWMPADLWDLHTPSNQFDLELILKDAMGRVLDSWWTTRCGFREFWIEGRDFYLNGTRLFLSALPLDNAEVSAALATYAAARESLLRLQTLGINLVYTHNYGCEPGSHLGFEEILRAADDVGMLVAFSQPHFSHYDWQAANADRENGYAPHAAFYVRAAGSHPSVVAYAMSHNATGYNEDMNPDLIDGVHAVRDSWAERNVRQAGRAESIVRGLDQGRIIYHHASGNLGPMHVSNFYPNFVPAQELSDWFEHWATEGVKPVFLCEYGAPFTWDWAMYRGWYKGRREFGSAVVPWEFCLAEWNAQFLGDAAFPISEMEKRNLRWEAKQYREGRAWHRWDYPHQLGSTDFPERDAVFARYFTENWRAFRTWGVSANSPWEHHILFRRRPGLDRNRREELPVDWAHLQRPGFSPDFLEARFERMDTAYERHDWIPTAAAGALRRNNGPLLAYIAGKPARFTSKDHVFTPGERFEKQVVVINNSRRTVTADCVWSVSWPTPTRGSSRVTVETGQQSRIPLELRVPQAVPPGEYTLRLRAQYDTGEVQEDEFALHVVGGMDLQRWETPQPRPGSATTEAGPRTALWDPLGQSARLLEKLGVRFERVSAEADLAPFEILVVGKQALTTNAAAPNLEAVRRGLKVLVFEQTAEALEQRLGFRVAEYGLRQVFPRIPGHPALAGLEAAHLRDWRGEATLSTPRLEYELDSRFNGAPTVRWCGLPVTRAWRCGCQGNVASVLIEKPARGDFLPIVDGGFSLQYSPLLEFREGSGVVLFCQVDVTGRTEAEPAAERLAANLVRYLSAWKSTPERAVLYVGEPAGRKHLEIGGYRAADYRGGVVPTDAVLVAGSGCGGDLAANAKFVRTFLEAGGRLLGVGLAEDDASVMSNHGIQFEPGEHLSASFAPEGLASPFAGIGPADLHCRDPRVLPRVVGGAAQIRGDGVLAQSTNANLVIWQLAPWQFDYRTNPGVKRTFRRASFVLGRLLSNLGVRGGTPWLDRWAAPANAGEAGRWLSGLYLDVPEEWDDPYRFFRW